MPKILDKLVISAEKRGVPKAMAYGMAVASLQKAGILRTGSSTELTEKGKKMNRLLTPKQLSGHNRKKKLKKTTPSRKPRSLFSKATKGRKPMKKMTTRKKKS
tara:strand:- start:81 stop:389 length:309 start_codon:yes stop_codon:yes gene_type:complete